MRDAERDGDSGDALVDALDRICTEAEQAIADGDSLIVLSDRATRCLMAAVCCMTTSSSSSRR